MNSVDPKHLLKDVYRLIAELWCSPPQTDIGRQEIEAEAKAVVERLQNVDKQSAKLLSKFIQENRLSEEDYINLFELQPECALYLGSHRFDEPKTCANAAVSDRNGYMIELLGIYKHFGRVPNGKELPDYLPLMVDFLALTIDSKYDPVREKLTSEYFLPFLPRMRSRLEELKTPYLHLLDALERVINIESKTLALVRQRAPAGETHVG